MSLSGCSIVHVEPHHGPNAGRIIINDNFDCIENTISNLTIVSATGSTSISAGTNVSTSLTIISGVPNYTVSVVDDPIFNSITATTYYSGSTNLNDLISNGGVFTSNIPVSLTAGKTVGRYVNGDTIPSLGKTAQEVFFLIAQEALPPTVSLTSPTTIQFNQTTISNVLNFSYVINSFGASVSTVLLETRRNNAGAWSALTTNTGATTYTHSLTDTAFNAQPFNYRYTVTDTAGGTLAVTLNITPAAYVAPTIVFTAPATTTPVSPETNQIREKGNISSTLQGTVTRNSPLVNVLSYQLYYSLNGGANVAIGSSVALGVTGGAIGPTINNDVALAGANTIQYFAYVTDTYTAANNTSYLITFKNMIFYAPTPSQPITSAAVRALTNKIFADGANPFILNTGNVEKIFSVAMPATQSITNVIDIDALNANITANYVLSTFNVNDAYGNPVSYNVYTMTNAIPYAANHQHQVTRA